MCARPLEVTRNGHDRVECISRRTPRQGHRARVRRQYRRAGSSRGGRSPAARAGLRAHLARAPPPVAELEALGIDGHRAALLLLLALLSRCGHSEDRCHARAPRAAASPHHPAGRASARTRGAMNARPGHLPPGPRRGIGEAVPRGHPGRLPEMRTKRLNRWVAGGIAGCPGTVDVSPTEESPASAPTPRVLVTNAAHPRMEQRAGRNGWITAAAVILLVEGGFGILYVPNLVGGDLGPLQPVGILIGGVSALSIAAGLGLLRLDGWARLAAGALAGIRL